MHSSIILENPMDRGAWWATVHGHKELDMTEEMNTLTQNRDVLK